MVPSKINSSFIPQDVHIIDDLCSSTTGNNLNSQESLMVPSALQHTRESHQTIAEIQENHALQMAIHEVEMKEHVHEELSVIRDKSTC